MIIGLMMAKNHSNRLENKNLLEFDNGLPIFEYSLKEALSYPWFDEFFVISNCKEIEEICKKYDNVVFLQEPEVLAEQNNSWKVIKFFMRFTGLFPEDLIVYINSMTPLRESKDIKNAIALWDIHKGNGCSSVVSVRKCGEHPEWSFVIKDGYLDIKNLKMTSQELKTHYHLNGAIYISSVENLEKYDGYFGKKIKPYKMPYERSIDIDDMGDYYEAKRCLKSITHKFPFHAVDKDSEGKKFESEVDN